MIGILIYLALCLMVGWAGRRRRIGFIGFVIFSVLLTPIICGLILFISGPKKVHVVHVPVPAAPPSSTPTSPTSSS